MTMRSYSRRRRFYATFKFWFVVIAVSVCAGTWYLGLIPIEFGGVETGRLADSTSAAPDVAQDEARQTSHAALPDTVDPLVFSEQEEPTVGLAQSAGMPDGSNEPTTINRSIAARRWNEPQPPELTPPLGGMVGARTDMVGRSGHDLHTQNERLDSTSQSMVFNASSTFPSPTEPNATRSIAQVAATEERSTSDVETGGNAPAERVATQTYEMRTASREDGSAAPPTPAAFDVQELDRLIESGDDIEAHRRMSTLYWNQPELRPLIQQRIDSMAKKIYFSPQPHYLAAYVIQPGDQLRKIAVKYNVTWQYLASLNRVDPQRIQAGQKLKVLKGPFAAVVDLSDFGLTVHAHGYFVRNYPIGIGKDNSSPIGKFTVLNKVLNPQYTDPQGHVIAGDDPNNPLGDYWLDIGDGFGIHGTIHPESIGRAESRGCIRMRNEDVAEVYHLLTVGSEVIIQR